MNSAQGTTTTQYLTFKLGEENFAIDVIKAQEVLDFVAPTRVPQTPSFMLGVINLRGSVVPVIDLRLKFGLRDGERTRDTCIIVMEIEVDGERTVVGTLVDSVREVLDLNAENLEPPPRIGTRLKTEFIKAMGKLDGDFLIILDIDRVFSTNELVLIEDALQKKRM
ncbi:chemotaxis protein CheW [Desulfuromonas sp. TF]|jgi:purine-binding chemotaxis protein CheW|uniref:chemotaxis protein CheW n=1 Tax=Desulfuromonas sp. TF TaxID=1232410 RepID=UPI0003FCA3A4|nr:chemotaxis protein CheW [Desulfuromonas sp. TF]